jgi:hypothetical protein
MHLRVLPLDHAGVVLLPALHEQALLGEVLLRVDDDDARFLVALGLEHVRHHRHALVGAGRAAVGIGRRDHHDGRAVRQRVELALEQLRLRAGLPGVRQLLADLF